MQELRCEKCKIELCYTQDGDPDGDVVPFNVNCMCGHINKLTFLGYPKLWGTPLIYFDFTDEYEITCKPR